MRVVKFTTTADTRASIATGQNTSSSQDGNATAPAWDRVELRVPSRPEALGNFENPHDPGMYPAIRLSDVDVWMTSEGGAFEHL